MHKASSEVSTKSPNFVRKTFDALLGRKNRRRSVSAVELYDSSDFSRERGTSVKSVVWMTCFYIGQSQPNYNPKTINSLGDSIFLKIFSYLGGKDILNVSRVNSRFRRLVLENADSFNRLRIHTHEVIYRFSHVLNEVQVQALSLRRSITPRSRSCVDAKPNKRLKDLLIPNIIFEGPVTFENNVPVSRYIKEIQAYYSKGRFIPTSFSFKGGSLSDENIKNGANLRGFNEGDIVKMIRFFNPHLRSVHLMTSRNFKLKSYPPKFLSLFDQLEEFIMVYEYPTLQIRLHEILDAVKKWQSVSAKHSTTFYIQHPYCTQVEIEAAMRKFEPQILESNDSQLRKLIFSHTIDTNFSLTFIFHQ